MFPHTAECLPVNYSTGRQLIYLRTLQFCYRLTTLTSEEDECQHGPSHFCSALHVAMQLGLYHHVVTTHVFGM